MLKTENKPMVVYHWWCDDAQIKPYQDMASPVVLSIAVLRAQNRSIPITVLDLSQKQDWGCFPELLNFRVVKWTPLLDLRHHKSNRLCSRVWDVWEYAKQANTNNIIFSDADIFWIKNPLPLFHQESNGDLLKFYCSSNTGVCYFDKTSKISEEVIRLWKFIISRVLICDKDFFDEISLIVPTALDRHFQDEVAFGHLICQYPELYCPVAQEENYMIYRLINDEVFDDVRCLHALGAVLGKKRGLICLALKELKDAIERVLRPEQMQMIFGDVVCNQVYAINEIKTISHQKLKELLEFTGCLRAEELINELKVKDV